MKRLTYSSSDNEFVFFPSDNKYSFNECQASLKLSLFFTVRVLGQIVTAGNVTVSTPVVFPLKLIAIGLAFQTSHRPRI